VDWDIADNMRVDIVGYTKPGFSGTRHQVSIFPSGRQGDLPDKLGSLFVAGHHGVRVILKTSVVGDWTEAPWRCVQLVEGETSPAKDGRPAVGVPDLDLLDPITARRSDPDFEQSYPIVDRPEDGKGWTFGRPGGIKDRVVQIRVERIP